jgi:hypothetical protein
MEKGTWAQIILSAPATSWSGYRWAEHAWEEVWEQVWDAGGEEKGKGIAGAEGNASGGQMEAVRSQVRDKTYIILWKILAWVEFRAIFAYFFF